MAPMPPELRRTIATAVLRGCLGRDPSAGEVAQALFDSGGITDMAALIQHVAHWFRLPVDAERTTLKRKLARAQAALREADMQLTTLEDELSSLRASTSWRLTRPIRAAAGSISPSRHQAIRNAVSLAYRIGTLRGLPPAPEPVRLPFGPGTNPYDTAAAWCTAAPPVVSIIILNRDAGTQTIECVQRIWACTTGIPYEIIIADNGSDAPDLLRLSGIGNGVRVIRIGTDRFFGEANNIAAEAARGEFICLLNNSVRVGDGWLASLHAAMRDDPSVAAAAPRVAGAKHAAPSEPAAPRDLAVASADALLLDLATFLSVGGFDLAYEPGGLAEVDLCYKLRLIGRSIRDCPQVAVTRLDSIAATQDSDALDAVNTDKLLARWGDWPDNPTPAAADRLRREIIPAGTVRVPESGTLPRAAIFTPYLLTPGGGERVIMTLAAVLSRTHAVDIVTIHPYSRARLANMGQEFSLDLSACALATYGEYKQAPKPDIWVTLGNHIYPPVPGGGWRNWYICQFPFPMDRTTLTTSRADLAGYSLILTYSEFALAHVKSGLLAERIHEVPAEVLYPPVLLVAGNAAAKRPMILSVGRFIARGHSKRHDALIDAFRSLYNRCGGSLEYHIVGSSFPTEGDMEYLTQLKAAAADIPITFHVNANKEKLATLFRDAMFYWHATGYGSDTADAPERAEHFGISIVEAMSAECVALAFAAGGPCEIIRNGKTGFLFGSLDELVDQTAALLDPARTNERLTIARAASDAARRFSLDAFQDRVEQLVDPRLESVATQSA
jgi:glycosyltransferase involved in cell wall biosynthesis